MTSVPNQCLALGPLYAFRMSISRKVYGETNFAKIATSASRIRTTAEAMASLWRRNRRHASWRVDNARSAAPTYSTGAAGDGGVALGAVRSPVRVPEVATTSWPSGITDPRIQDRVRDVRD